MNVDDSNNDDIDVKDDIFNYRGYFIENPEEDEDPKYFEFGAHFQYKALYNALRILRENQIKEEKGKQIEKIIQISKKKIANKERNNTKIKKKDNSNLNNIINIFKFKGRSRNIGVDGQEENQNELTFVPKINVKNNLSVKKEEKNQSKSLHAYKTNFNRGNYMKIYKNIKNKMHINSNSNKKNNNSNNKFKKTWLNQNKINKYSDKYILNKNKKNIYQQINLFTNIKTLNQDNNNNCSCDLNMQKSFQTQMKEVKSNSKKNYKLETLTFNSNLKEIMNKKNKSIKKETNRKKTEIIDNRVNQNLINKNIITKKKGNTTNINVDKLRNSNSSNNDNNKSNLNKLNRKMISTPLECLLNSYKSKNNKHSPDIGKKILGIFPTVNSNYNSSYKLNIKKNNKNKNNNNKNDIRNISLSKHIPGKLNEQSDIYDSRGIISISMDNNKKNFFNEKKTEKVIINKEKNFATQTSYNNNITFPNISSDNFNKKKTNNNTISSNNNKRKIESNNSKENLNYLYEKNEKNSRNKKTNFLINNISSINYTDNININTINSNDLAKINNTHQNHKFFKNKNMQIKQNKTFVNLKKNKPNNERHKKILIGIPSSSKKKSYISQMENNLFNNYNSTGFIGKKVQKSKVNNSYINKLLINKSKQRINLVKRLMNKSKNPENNNLRNNQKTININNVNNSSNIIRLSKIKKNLKNNSVIVKDVSSKSQTGLKKYQSLIHKKDNKNNINISININNNNNIIYNKIINNQSNNTSSSNIKNYKIPLKINIQKVIKSPSLKKNKTSLNNFKFKNNANMLTNNITKNKMTKTLNANIKNDDKVKFINIQFPKAKFLNIFNTSNK